MAFEIIAARQEANRVQTGYILIARESTSVVETKALAHTFAASSGPNDISASFKANEEFILFSTRKRFALPVSRCNTKACGVCFATNALREFNVATANEATTRIVRDKVLHAGLDN